MFFSHKNLLFYLKKSNKCTISLCFLTSRSRYRSSGSRFFGEASAPVFFQAAPAPRGQKQSAHTSSGSNIPGMFITAVLHPGGRGGPVHQHVVHHVPHCNLDHQCTLLIVLIYVNVKWIRLFNDNVIVVSIYELTYVGRWSSS